MSCPGRAGVPVSAGQSVVEIDALARDAEFGEAVVLGCEVLLVGGAAVIANPGSSRAQQCNG